MKREAVFLWVGLVLAMGLSFQNCAKNMMVDVPSLAPSQGILVQSKPLCIFNGKEIAEGKSQIAFLNSTPEFTNGCLSETRICKNGVLSGTFTYASCKSGPKACLFNGITLESGSSITAYTAPNPTDCASEMRTCLDGRLSGSYLYSSCKKDVCLFSGRSLNPGEAFTYYLNSSGSCQALTGSCQSGGFLVNSQRAPLNGASIYAACSTSAGSCLLQGQTIAQNQTFNYYATSTSCQARQGYCDTQGSLRDSGNQSVLTGAYADGNSCNLALINAGNTSNPGSTGGGSGASNYDSLPTCTWRGHTFQFGQYFNYYHYSEGYVWMCQPSQGLCAPDGSLRTPLYQPLNPNSIYDSCTILEPPPVTDSGGG